ncbi:MAG: CYTH domain-containing protein [Gammaproteobacteria bacterium]|nr:CYTH domain-containing protein [Gammaproteobacteria bacterium]
MAEEIERKFLVSSDDWRAQADEGTQLVQGYLETGADCTVRVRIAGEKAYLCIKGATRGISRDEFEYTIPMDDARQMLRTLAKKPYIEKRRFLVKAGPHTWEVDVFSGDNEGLTVAEIELSHADEAFVRPGWLGDEVSADPRYRNAALIEQPYKQWVGATIGINHDRDKY